MRKGITVIGLVVVVALIASSIPNILETTKRTPHDIGSTMAQFSNLSSAIQIYESEYSTRLSFSSQEELLEVLSGKNEKGIKFHSFTERETNQQKQIVDYWDTPIIATAHSAGYILISAGRDGVFDHIEHEDDIIFHMQTKHIQTERDNG